MVAVSMLPLGSKLSPRILRVAPLYTAPYLLFIAGRMAWLDGGDKLSMLLRATECLIATARFRRVQRVPMRPRLPSVRSRLLSMLVR